MRHWFIPATTIIMMFISVITLNSIAPTLATPQLIFFGVGVLIMMSLSQLPFHFLQSWRWQGYWALCLLLIITFFLGPITRGSSRWISIGGLFLVQASQLAVPLASLLISSYIAEHGVKTWQSLAKAVGLISIPAVLILIEPDLGTTIIYLLSMGVILFLANLPWKYIVTLGFLSLGAGIFAWFFVLQPYQKNRVIHFLDSSQSPDQNYNAEQALIAVGSGQLTGRGIGEGIQSRLRFLPERQTDFIFAAISEEWGFIGSSIIISLYFGLTLFLLTMAYISPLPAARYYLGSIAFMISFQSVVHMGMNMHLFPIKGVTLPLLSYGGSSILSVFFSLGIAQACVKTTRQLAAQHIH